MTPGETCLDETGMWRQVLGSSQPLRTLKGPASEGLRLREGVWAALSRPHSTPMYTAEYIL